MVLRRNSERGSWIHSDSLYNSCDSNGTLCSGVEDAFHRNQPFASRPYHPERRGSSAAGFAKEVAQYALQLPRLRLLRRDLCRPAKVVFFCSCNRRNRVGGVSLCVVQTGSLRETRLHPSQRSGRCAEAVPCKWFLSAFQYELFGIRKLQKSTDPEAAFFAAIRKKLRISPKNMGSFIPLCRG